MAAKLGASSPPKPAAPPRSSPWPVIIIIFIFIIFGAAAYGYLMYQNEQLLHSVTITTPSAVTSVTPPPDDTKPSTSSAETINVNQKEFTIPINNADEWQLVSEAQNQLGQNALIIYNNSGFSNEWYMKYASLEGDEYIRTITITGDSNSTITDTSMTFEEEQSYLSDFGFSQEIAVDSYRLVPPIADGPQGGVNGYVRQFEGGIQVYLSSTNSINVEYGEPTGNTPPQPVYPYDIELREFISNPISLEDLLEIAQEQ